MILKAEQQFDETDLSNTQPPFVPTPAEIAAECRLIRSTWSRDEWVKRRVSMPSELDREFEPCDRTVAETIQRTEKPTPARSCTMSSNAHVDVADQSIVP